MELRPMEPSVGVPDWSVDGGFSVDGLEGDVSLGWKIQRRLKDRRVLSALALGLLLLAALLSRGGGSRRRGGGDMGGSLGAAQPNTTVTLESANTVDDCASTPCLNAGGCVDLPDAFACNCLAGFRGDQCGTREKHHCPADNECDRIRARCTPDAVGGSGRRALQTLTCRCSGRSNYLGQGSDCGDTDSGGAWCLTTPGACSDGLVASSSVGSEWSYMACCGQPGASDGCAPSTVAGCRDPAASNFDPMATVQDGSCTYPNSTPPPPPAPALPPPAPPKGPPPPPPPTRAPTAGYTCSCHVGYSSVDGGRTCLEDTLCTDTTCLNGGECIERVGYTECRCGGGFTGLDCSQPPPAAASGGDPVSGMGRPCETDADCAGHPHQEYCRHEPAHPADPDHTCPDGSACPQEARAARQSCMIINCQPGGCPTIHAPAPQDEQQQPASMATCCMQLEECAFTVRSQ